MQMTERIRLEPEVARQLSNTLSVQAHTARGMGENMRSYNLMSIDQKLLPARADESVELTVSEARYVRKHVDAVPVSIPEQLDSL